MTLKEAVKSYRLFHRRLKEFREVEALSAQEACENVRWLIGDTWVRVRTPVISDPSSESGHSGGGLANCTPRDA